MQCSDPRRKSSTTGKELSYPSLPYNAIHFNQKIHDNAQELNSSEENINVLIIGLDSISHLQFQRMLPDTYRYLTNEMKAQILQGEPNLSMHYFLF